MGRRAADNYSAEFKARAVLAGEQALAAAAERFGVEPQALEQWLWEARGAAAAPLSQGESLFRRIVDQAPVMIWMTDPSGYSTYLNRPWYEFTGQGPGEGLGFGWLDAVHPEDRANTEAMFAGANAMADREARPVHIEYRLRHRDGDYRWAIDVASPQLGDDGEFLGYLGAVIDISERKQAEERLRDSESRYRTLFESIDQGFCIIEMLFDEQQRPVDYRFFETNPVFEAQTGLQRPVGRTARELVPELDEFWFRTYGRVALTGEPVRFEHEAPAMGRWFEVYALRVGGADSRRVALLFSDVSERKRAEQALHESERQFRELADSMPQLVWITRPDGENEYLNRRWREFTGFEPSRSAAQQWVEVLHPDDYERTLARWHYSVQTGTPFEIEYRLRSAADGGYHWFLGRALPVRDAGGRIERWFGTSTDIEAQKRAEAALREADQRKNEFLAMLGHELRNPLASLAVAVELQDRPGLDAARLSHLRELSKRQVGTLSRLVDDLLDVSRITRGQIELQRERVDLRRVVEGALEGVRGQLQAKRHELVVQLPPAPLEVQGDPVRLEQVVVNLLSNAGKYTDPGGRIEVVLETHESAARLRVRDSGIGLAADSLGRIFDLFGQAPRGLDRSEGGLGIGLTIVRRLVELHGGRVEAFSAGIGEGTEFTVTLPLVPHDADRQQRRAPVLTTGDGKRVLVVDDNADAANALALLLEQEGHRVDVAVDGPSGLARAAELEPDLILLDIGLPGMDGYEVARRLRQAPRTRSVVLAALTGYGQAADRARAREVGFDAHFVKPVDIGALMRFIHEVAAETGGGA